jgi:riboflavin biosynthesis pyrimidine reductase
MNRADDLAAAFEALRVSGVTRLSCVGGRHLARQCLERGLVDDLYLTTSAQPGGEPDTPLHPRGVTGRTIVRKHGTGPETGVVFEHVARPRPRG